jgi:diguanylate cyclase (GGDEF)-like protein
VASGAAYLAALAAARWLPGWGAWAAAALLAAIAAWVFTRRRSEADGVAAAGPALHFALIATGSLASPLIALAGVWVFLVGRALPSRALAAAAAAAILVPLGALVVGAEVGLAELLRYELVVGAGGALPLVAAARSRREGPAGAPEPAPISSEPRADSAATDAEVVGAAMELLRRATDAQEATLWKMDGERGTAELRARSAPGGVPEPDHRVVLDGHPFRWAIDEQMHVHLQRGRRELPAPWASEMLLIPVDLPQGVLALAYPGVVPPGAEATALQGGHHLSALVSLLRVRADTARGEARSAALRAAVLTLPGELELEPFARLLAEAVRSGLGAEGVAVALAPGPSGVGKILHVAAEEGRAPKVAAEFEEGDSRLALSIKHGVELAYRDLRGERDRIPLLVRGEQWSSSPRSAAIIPLIADGVTLGAVAAWHPDPARFGAREMELLRDLRSIAPPPLRGGLRLGEVEQRASTDALTALPNRASFESRLAAAGAYFDRYARPFSVLVLDVDFFKKFNDTHGHEVGDRVLKHVADLVRGGVRDLDLPARLGGEEFVVLLPETPLRASADAAERLRRSIEGRPLIWNGAPLRITASIGVASCPECTATPADVLRLADAALYRAKEGGRNRVAMAPRVGTGSGAEM